MAPHLPLVPPRLPLLRLALDFLVEEPAVVPPFRGAMWRGILGPALKLIDDGLMPGLSTGELAAGSLYRTFFESPPPPAAAKMRLYSAVPHPYVIDAPGRPGFRRIEAGEREQIELTLVGRPASAAEAVLAAFDFAARSGFGTAPNRGRARLVAASALWRGPGEGALTVYDDAGYHGVVPTEPPIPDPPAKVRVLLITPLRLLSGDRLLGPASFRPAALVSNLVRRISMMMSFHGTAPLETDFVRLKALWEGLGMERPMLAMADQTRWSASQGRELDMGGLIGSFILDLRGAEALFPYLWLGQWLHAGKGTVMGMGAIRLRPEPG